jgi:hypothetical protein
MLETICCHDEGALPPSGIRSAADQYRAVRDGFFWVGPFQALHAWLLAARLSRPNGIRPSKRLTIIVPLAHGAFPGEGCRTMKG